MVQIQINADNLFCVCTSCKKNKTPFEESGGRRQRSKQTKIQAANVGEAQVELEEPANVRPDLDSEQVFHWLRMWAWGEISARERQREALRSHNDFQRVLGNLHLSEDFMPKSLMQVARLGQWGTYPGNIPGN